MKMASEYDCGHEEDTPQNGVNFMNVVGEYLAVYDKDKSKKANA